MKPRLAFAAWAFLVASLLAAAPEARPQGVQARVSAAQAPGTPLLPPSEHLVYSRTTGEKRDRLETSIRLVEAGGVSWYEVSSHSEEQDSVLRLDPDSLFASYTEVTSRGSEGTLRRVTSVVERRGSPGDDVILVQGTESLPFSLRAFPWGLKQKARLAFMGSGTGGSFRFDFAVTGKETVQAAGRGIECWKSQLSFGGIIGTFVGKSYLWHSVAWPHYLVKSESSSGPPGSPQSLILLESYSSP